MIWFLLLLLIVILLFVISKSAVKPNISEKPKKVVYPVKDKSYSIEVKEVSLPKPETSSEEKDAYERTIVSNPTEYRTEFEIEIDYKDRNGLKTTRQVKVRGYRISEDKKECELWGYCYLRNGSRTFYASRMERLVDLDTGEVAVNIIDFLEAKYLQSPEGEFEEVLKRRKAEIDILVYVGRLDNQLRQNKKDVIIKYVMNKEPEARITKDTINEYLKKCGKVSKTMFGRLLTQVSDMDEEERKGLIKYASLVLEAKKGKKNMEEEKVIEHMERRLLNR